MQQRATVRWPYHVGVRYVRISLSDQHPDSSAGRLALAGPVDRDDIVP